MMAFAPEERDSKAAREAERTIKLLNRMGTSRNGESNQELETTLRNYAPETLRI
jgi:hypothetical protein